MNRFFARRPIDISRSAARRLSALQCESLEQRDVPSGNPPVGSIPRQLILEDSAATTINLSSFFTDPENDPLSFAIVSQTNSTGIVTTSFDAANQNLTITPAANAYGYSYFRMTVNDGSNTVNTTMELIVRELDDLTNDAPSVGSSTAINLNVLANDGAVDGTRLAEAGNMKVVQNDPGNAATSVTVSFPTGTPDMKAFAAGSNRGDFAPQIGTSFADDVANGLVFGTSANNGRDNGEGVGAQLANTAIDRDATNLNYFLSVNRAGDGGEWNTDQGVAYFPYANGWMAGWIVNLNGTNGGANDTIRSASPNGGFNVGSSALNVIRDLGTGQTRVTIPGINSQTDGILLAIHGKNEDNYALCTPEAGGSWLLTVRDNGTSGTSPTAGNEQDPVAFVYIPKNMPNVVSGRVLGNGTVEMSSGVYTMTKTGTGTYQLSIPGQSPLTGTLVLSPEGGTSTNCDDFATFEPSGNNWVIKNWDITGSAVTNIPVAEDVGATTRAFSFAFIPFLNTTTPRITSVQNTSSVQGVSNLGATVSINLDGTINYNPLTSSTIQNLAPLASTTDTFTYTTTNLSGLTTTATVTVTVTAPSVLYVDDAWASLNSGDTIQDANPVATGDQNAIFGTTAFASLNAAIAAAAINQKITVNAGNYLENVIINKQVEITFQQSDSTFNSISDTLGTASIIIQPNVTVTFGDSLDREVSSPISGGGSIVKTGTGTLTLAGANTYSGSTSVNTGNLVAGSATGLSPNSAVSLAAGTELRLNGFNGSVASLAGTGNVTNNSTTNVTLTLNTSTDVNFAGNILTPSTGTISLVKQGSAAQQLNGTNALAAITVSAGILRAGGAAALGTLPAVTVNGGTLSLNGFNYTFATLDGLAAGTVNNASATNATLTVDNAATSTFPGTLANGSTGTLSVIKTGSGIFNANGVNTLTGGFVVRQGTLQTNNSNGWGTGSITLGDAGTGTSNVAALISSNGVTIANAIMVSAQGTGTATFGTTAGITGAVNTQVSGSLTLNRDVILQAGSADRTTFAGLISGTGNITVNSTSAGQRIAINRGATLPANDFVGDITITAGSVLQLGVASLFSNGNVPDASSIQFATSTSELRLTTSATTPDVEAVNALISLVPGAGLITRPNGVGVLNFAIGAGNCSGDYSGTIANAVGTLNLIKLGSGTQTLSGANTYNGTTQVAGGTLLAANTAGSAFGPGAVTVDNGATLGGTGSFSGTLALNGRLTPGLAGAVGTLTTGPVTFGPGSILAIDIANTGASFDLANIAEGSSLSGTTLVINAGTGLTLGQSFLVLDNVGAATLGNFANGTTITAANNQLITFSVSTTAGSGNDVQLSVAAIAAGPYVDVVAGVATFFADGNVNNAMTLTNNGTTYTLDDTVGADIALTPAAITAGWSVNAGGSVSGPVATTTGLVLKLGDGANTVGQFSAATNVTLEGTTTLTSTGAITTSGDLTLRDFVTVAVQSTITAANITTTNINTISGTAAGKLVGGTLTLNAGTIGSSFAKVKTQATTIVAASSSGGIYLTEDDGATITANAAAPGSVDIDNLAGTLMIGGASSTVNGSITLASAGALTVNAAISSTSGNISLVGQNAVILAANVNAGSGTIAITANADGLGTEGFNQTAGTITTTNTSATAAIITANTTGGGTGNISLDSTAITGRLTVNSNGGSILYAGTTPLDVSQQGLQNGGSGPSRLLVAANYIFTATGAGSIGTSDRPIQSAVPATNTVLLSAGDGGVYWTDWNNPVVLTGATATNGGNVRVVAANVGGHDLTVTGPVTTGFGSIYLAADDNFNISAPIGGPGFSGTVYLAGNRDQGNGLNLRMNTGSSITTTNATANAVLLEGFTNNGTAAGGITLNSITVGNGGTITLTTRSANSFGDIINNDSSVVLNAGANGTVAFTAYPYAVSSSAIGTASSPIIVAAGNVIATTGGSSGGNGSMFITATQAANFTTSVVTGGGNISLATSAGVLTIAGPTSTASNGSISLTGAGGIIVNGGLNSTTTGNLTLNAGTNNAILNSTLTLNAGQTLTTTANGGTKISTGTLAGVGSANAVTLLSGGTVSPAGTAIGKLDVGNFAGASGGILRLDIDGTAPGTSHDQLVVTGTANLGGLTPQVFLGTNYTPTLNDEFTILTSTGAASGAFASGTFLAANNSAVTFTATVNANDVKIKITNIVSGPVLDIVGGVLTYNGGGNSIDNDLSINYIAGNYVFSESNEVITLGPGAAGLFTGSNGNKTFTGNSPLINKANVTLGAGGDKLTLNGVNHAFNIDGGGQVTDLVTINAALNFNGNLTITGVNDIAATAGSLIEAGTVTLTATNAIGSGTQSLSTKASTIIATAGAGGVFLTEADGATITATAGDAGITVTNAANALNFTGSTTGAGNIAVTNTANTLTIGGATSTATGTINFSSGDAVILNADVTSASGTITINANTDGVGNEGYDQKAATVTTGNTTANALSIIVNQVAGGTGDAIIGKGTVGSTSGGTIQVNSRGGSILWSNDPSYTAFGTAQQGTAGGGSNTQVIAAQQFFFTSTGAGSIGTSARPIQTNAVAATDDVTGGATADLASGTGGIYLVDWFANDLTLNNAVAAGGDIRVVAANAGGSNLFVVGNVFTASGNILLAADDELTLDPTANIGGATFAGTIDLIANRDAGNNQTVNMTAGSKLITTNAGANAVTIQSFSGNGSVPINTDLLVGGVILTDVTVGTGGTINVIAGAGTATARQGSIIQRPGTTLNAPAGTVNLTAFANTAATASTNNAGNIGVGGDTTTPANFPIRVNAIQVNASTTGTTLANTGNINIISTTGATFAVATTGSTASTITLLTQAGALTVGAPLTTTGGAVALTGADGVTLNAPLGGVAVGAISITGNLTGSASTTLGAGNMTVSQPGNSTYAGSIGGAQGLVKELTGTLTLTATNSFTGATTVNAGTLLVNGSIATSSGVTVAATGTLGGTGTVPATTVAGTITGGTNGGAGTLTATNLTATGTVLVDLLGVNVGDQLAVTGNVDITGAKLTINAPNAIPAATSFKVIDNQGTNPLVGKFTNAPNEGDTITANGQTFVVSYAGDDVTVTRQGTAAPTATGFTVNGGAAQRSRITTITVNFSGPVVAANFNTLGAIKLTRTAVASPATGVIGDIVQTGPTANNHITVTQGTSTSLTLTFDNNGSYTTENTGVENGSLSDGFWKLEVGAVTLDTGTLALRRLYGDSTATANGQVSGDDFLDFGNFFNSNDSRYDYNNDGTISGADALIFGNRFGRSL